MTLTAPHSDLTGDRRAAPGESASGQRRLHDLEALITSAILRRHPDAVAWSVTATNAASGRPGHFYFDEPVTVYTRAGDELHATEIGLRGTPAAGAAYDLSLHVPATRGTVHAVTVQKGPRP